MNGNTITVYRMKTRDIVPYIYIDRPIVAKSPWTIGLLRESGPDRLPYLLDESPASLNAFIENRSHRARTEGGVDDGKMAPATNSRDGGAPRENANGSDDGWRPTTRMLEGDRRNAPRQSIRCSSMP